MKQAAVIILAALAVLLIAGWTVCRAALRRDTQAYWLLLEWVHDKILNTVGEYGELDEAARLLDWHREKIGMEPQD